MGQPRARLGRHLAGLVGAMLLGIGLAMSPAGAARVAAADPLQVTADATYTLDPAAGRVHVLIQYRVKDLKPSSAQFIYFYSGYRFAVQPEARSIRASDSGGALAVETRSRKSYIELSVDFRRNLFYGQTASFSIRYDLVGGAPRSASSIRIGKAYSTWGVWAWGDAGRSSVAVNLPEGFESSIVGSPMATSTEAGRETLRAEPDSPATFFAILSAEDRFGYTEDRLSLAGDVEVVVMAWPEDPTWDDTVKETLRAALPALHELIGLDWPVGHDLDVHERFTPALEGYAGVFFTGEQKIDISEDLDPVTIAHEASHAWLNSNLFEDRWIYEGLAQEYAWRTLRATGGEDGGLPAAPVSTDPGFVSLQDWSFPQVIRDQQTDDSERYGYEAAFWVIHRIVDEVGPDRMREVFAAAHAHDTAYPGAGKLEPLVQSSDWRHLLDLLENADEADAADLEAMVRELVLPPGSRGVLDRRTGARQAYRELVVAGGGWLPGWFIRKPMGQWAFDIARKNIAAATAFLEQRAQVDAAAAALAVQPNGALRAAYEGAATNLDGATALANDQLATLSVLADARTKLDAEPDLVSTLGLLGTTPQVPYDAARAAFERGDLPGAKAAAAEAAAILAAAPATGQQRLAFGIGLAIGLLLFIIALFLLGRRRRRRSAAMAMTAMPATMTGTATTTLAADPNAAPPSTSEPPSELEGGATHGDPPADSASPSTA